MQPKCNESPPPPISPRVNSFGREMQGKFEALELLSGVGAGGGAEEEEGEAEVGLGSGIGFGSGRARTFPPAALPPPLLLFSPASFLPSFLSPPLSLNCFVAATGKNTKRGATKKRQFLNFGAKGEANAFEILLVSHE